MQSYSPIYILVRIMMRLIYLEHFPSLDRICSIIVSIPLFLPFKTQYPINLIYIPPFPFGGVNIIIAITSKYLITFPCFYKTPPRISHYPHNLPYTHEQLYEYPPPCMLPRTLTSHWSSTKNNYQYAVSQIHDHATHT